MRLHLFTHIVLRLQIDLRSDQQLQAAMIAPPNRKHGGCLAILHTHTNKQIHTRCERDRERQRDRQRAIKTEASQQRQQKRKKHLLTRKSAHTLIA